MRSIQLSKPMPNYEVKNTVACYRAAGLEARWGHRDGTPFMFLRNPNSERAHQRETWWLVNKQMFEAMQRDGIVEGFNNNTLIGDVFSVKF